RPRRAVRELEVPDPGPPVERAVRRVVLVRVPEGAVVGGVDGHIRVVAPAAVRVRLAAGTREQGRLALGERVRRIAGQPPRIADLRVDAGRRSTEADGDVAERVHRGAAHPAPGGVGLVGALLDEAGRAGGGVVDLVPANASGAVRVHGYVADERFVAVGEAPVRIPEHAPVAEGVQRVADTGLGHT